MMGLDTILNDPAFATLPEWAVKGLIVEALARLESSSVGRKPPGAFVPHGVVAAALAWKGEEVILAGPAGTGKSRGCLEDVNDRLWARPGARYLGVRKTRASMNETMLEIYENKVLGPGNPVAAGPQRRYREVYNYPNGSEFVVAGLDNPLRAMSSEWDGIYVMEATELSETDWEHLTTRLGRTSMDGRVLADCNPGPPQHWLKVRADRGAAKMFHTRHEDNPVLYNEAVGEWTEQGRRYLARLDRLTGVRKARLRFGLWVSAEGAIYEEFDPQLHLIDRFDIPRSWPRFVVVDFGYTHPFVAQWWAQDDDGRLYRYREIYHTQRLVEDHGKKMSELSAGDGLLRAVICDHDAEGRATLERVMRLRTKPANKQVQRGIQAVQVRLRKAGDGKPRLFLLRDSLVEVDPDLKESGLPTCTEEELPAYVWATGARGVGIKEEPLKIDDHGCDTLRYMVAQLDVRRAASGGRLRYA